MCVLAHNQTNLLTPQLTKRFIMTASERAARINIENAAAHPDADIWLILTESSEHWAAIGIETGDELDHYLAMNEYVSVYKEVNGFKPSSTSYTLLTKQELESMTDSLIASEELMSRR